MSSGEARARGQSIPSATARNGVADTPVRYLGTARPNRDGRTGAQVPAPVDMVVPTTQLATQHSGLIPQSMGVLPAIVHSISNVEEYDDHTQLVLSLLADCGVEKFDSGASRCMSGDPNRTAHSRRPLSRPVRITGFNGIGSSPTSMGVNADGKEEYYVSDMPSHLTLLCANAYCQDGCAVLFEDGGLVLRMTKAELAALRDFLSSYPVVKELVVNNRTYEVDHKVATPEALTVIEVDGERARVPTTEDALSGIATRFFNTKVNVSNQEERILTLLMTGLTFRDLYLHVKNRSLSGLPPDLTVHGLNRFAHRFGRTPDILNMANPISLRDATGLRDPPMEPTCPGARIEVDAMQSPYNLRESVPGSALVAASVKTKKLPTHGGATAAIVCVDCYSSFVMGKLVKSVADPEVFVEGFLARFKLDNWPVSGLAADSGVVTNAQFQVMTTKVEQLCARWHVQKLERALPYNHARITGHVEIEIQLIKKLIRMAITLILRNPNFPVLGFTPMTIFKLWGEFYLWAIVVINLKPCPRFPLKTRWEVYYGVIPNMQDIRLLPIGCILIVVRSPIAENGQGVVYDGVTSNEQYTSVGLYVGPAAPSTPGAARVAVMSNGKCRILITNNFRAGTDGGGLNVYPHIERGLKQLLLDQIATGVVDGIEVEPETDSPLEPSAQQLADVQKRSAHVEEPSEGAQGSAEPIAISTESTGAEEQSTALKGPVRVKKSRSRGRGVRGRPRTEGVSNASVPEPANTQAPRAREFSEVREPSVEEDAEVPSVLRDEQVSHVPFKSVNMSHRGRRSYKVAGRLGVKVARGRSKSPEAVVAGSINALNGHRVKKATTAPTTEPTDNLAAARLVPEPTSEPTGAPTHVPTSEPPGTPTSANEPPKRSARIRERRERRVDIGGVAMDTVELETCCLADWSTFRSDVVYWSMTEFAFMQIESDGSVEQVCVEDGYRAVTENVPKSFEAALADPKWGGPAQKEINTILSAKTMVEVNAEVARDCIANHQADLMYLFPVYEEKLKEGEWVYKVRLVADGRTHHHAGETYSATPSREELFILMHIIAALGWDYAHIDEIRAFLKAPYKGENKAYVKFRGGRQYYEVLGALYGLKTAPRDYQEEVARRLESIGFTRLVMCSCIYIMRRGDDIVIIYDYVDDFIFTGNKRSLTEEMIVLFRLECDTTEPIWDADWILGMELKRDRAKRIIKITMVRKITEVCARAEVDIDHNKKVPIPTSGYIVKDTEFETMENQEMSEFLDAGGITQYMVIVGGLIWISGLRFDILFSTMYLAWNTKQPRKHHLKMARHVLSYLSTTKDIPLVLGGSIDLDVITYTDASLGTAPKGRSVTANITKLNEHAGAVSAHTKATDVVFTSSFESELDGVTRGLKSNSRVCNVIAELRQKLKNLPKLWSDNMAMVKFVQGEGVAKGVRHMELRMWYVRERYKQGGVLVDWMSGKEIPADKLTKLGTREEHEAFTRDIMGLCLLE